MAVSYLQVENLSKSYGDVQLFGDVSFGVAEAQKVAFIAPNGTGKTTILNIITGKETADTGKVTFRKDLRISYLEQEPKLNPQLTVVQQAFQSASQIVEAVGRYEQAIAGHDQKLLQRAMEEMDRLDAWNYEAQIHQILTRLQITDFERKVSLLSGGQRKRVALANILINDPDLIIMDEPTNHLDLEMIEWLEEYLTESRSSLLMVTHDRYFLDRVCTDIVEIDNRSSYTYKGNYSYYLQRREERMQSLSTEVGKAQNLLRTEIEWLGRMPKARTTKSKYRIDNVEKLQQIASQKLTHQELNIDFKTRRLGNKILDIYNLGKAFDKQLILNDFSYKFQRGEKIGIVGNNGTGKTTFLNIVNGLIPPDSGTIEVGETVVWGYYQQKGIELKQDRRVIEVIKDIAEVITIGNGKQLNAAQFLEHFLFTPDKQYTYVSKLSGGERRRLYLITILMRNPNFLVLDEPTNDLDIMTLTVLEDYLRQFQGCLMVVSHDRYFMDKVVDHLFVFEGEGEVSNFPGSYTLYRQWLAEQERLQFEAKQTAKEVAKTTNSAPVVRKKFNYKEQQEFDRLEKDIAELTAEKQNIENLMGNSNLAADKIMAYSERIAQIIKALDEKEIRWLEMSEMQE